MGQLVINEAASALYVRFSARLAIYSKCRNICLPTVLPLWDEVDTQNQARLEISKRRLLQGEPRNK